METTKVNSNITQPPINILTNPVNKLTTSVILQKAKKRKEKAKPILANVITPYAAFEQGCEEAIANFIKLGTESKEKVPLLQGPQQKTVETKIIETLLKSLLTNYNSVKFVQNGDKYVAHFKGKTFDLVNTLQKANFNHMSFSNKELASYKSLLDTGVLEEQPILNGYRPTATDFNNADPDGRYQALSYGEKAAINIYTGSAFIAMNSLLRGNIQSMAGFNPTALNKNVKENLLHIAIAVHGLNKIPDYVPSGLAGVPPKYVYRSEGEIPEQVLAKRKWSVMQGGQVSWEMGFISTAHQSPTFLNFGTKQGILFKNLKGKYIAPLSRFTGEREVLFPPTQVQWKYQKEIVVDGFRKMNLFIAKPVTVPV